MNEYFLLQIVNGMAQITVTRLSDFVGRISNGSGYYLLFEMSEKGAKKLLDEAKKHRIENMAKEIIAQKKIEHLDGYGPLIRF